MEKNCNYLTVLFILLTMSSWGQEGFNRVYNFTDSGVNFDNIVLRNDTLFLSGGIKNESLDRWEILFAELDTLGNVLNYEVYQDTIGDNLLAESNYGFIPTKDGGFAMVGMVFEREQGFLLKVNKAGKFTWFQEYIDNDIRSYFQRHVIELDDGFLIAGYKQKQNYFRDIFIMKTDPLGNKLWEKSYGESETNEICLSFLKLDENTFVIGGGQSSSVHDPLEELWSKSWIFTIDSLGVIKEEWKSEENEELHCNGLTLLPSGDWLYSSLEREITPFNDFNFFPKIVRRNKDFELIWKENIAVTPTTINYTIGIEPTPDGQYIAYGDWVPPANSGYDLDQYGCVHKINPSGYSIWTSCERRIWASEDSTSNEFMSGAVVLPSGSIIGVGRSDRYTPSPAQSYGWLFKLTADGCMDTLCNIIAEIAEAEAAKVAVKAYPNPASDWVAFEWEVEEEEVQIQILDVNGRLVEQRTIGNSVQGQFVWEIGVVPNGIYFYQLRSTMGMLEKGKVVVQQ